ncbi:ABC-2 type transport system ATP-binding protein [Sinobaca qinghaiensis]|uniref:ABC-2 type transport system ATP-binding protein n=1 Tax=Sinobaca qinghaiensis TaxID=342944 RepID=A0A419V4V7_9BACL|nr:ABC transporter ATP-binding protein [Sinobaca qinghaiensis]RKD73525.1 ABC-2 type transport system ATP-binding protein [Sinobaca qinghaiensis]
MEYSIEVNNVSKVFSNYEALKNLDFKVATGEIFGFLGPSGAGKTTTIKMLTNQLRPTDGEALVLGRSMARNWKDDFQQRMGVLTDNSALYERLSVYENLKLYCDLYDLSYSRIEEALEMVNLEDTGKKAVGKLSKGMTQRAMLARAFLHAPELLFLDEPTSALDPTNAAHIYKSLRELNKKGTTIFLTTHNMHEAETLCDRVAFLDHGKIQLLDAPQKLRRRFADNTMTIELTTGKKITLDNVPENAKKMYAYMADEQVASVHTNEPTLGDIFVKLTGRELV